MQTLAIFIDELNQIYFDNSPFWCTQEERTFRGFVLEQTVTRVLKTLGYKIPKHDPRSPLIDIRAYVRRISGGELVLVGEVCNYRYGINLTRSNIESIGNHFSQYPRKPKIIFISFQCLLRKHGQIMLQDHRPTVIEFGFQLLPIGEYEGKILTEPLTIETYNKIEQLIMEIMPRCPSNS